MPMIKCIEAHESEVLSIDITKQITPTTSSFNKNEDEGYLLVSGSRDSLIQIFDSKSDYEPV